MESELFQSMVAATKLKTRARNENIILKGQKIYLSPLEEGDLAQSRLWVNDKSLWPLMLRYLPVTSKDQKNWYEALVSDPAKAVFAVRTNKGKKHVGNTGFYEIDSVHRRANFWILIGAKEDWGKGYGTEAIQKMVAYGFENLNLNRIYLDVAEENQPAVRVYKKSGFFQEGLFREHCFIEGKYRNVLRMALLKKDYAS